MKDDAGMVVPETSKGQDAARVALGLMLMAAGTIHLTVGRQAFKAQVPTWIPMEPDAVVLASGVGEIALGAALVSLPKQKALMGSAAAGFFTAIFPGNVAQYNQKRDAFGLDTDGKRFARLWMQPVLIGWALWSAGSLRRTRERGGADKEAKQG